MRTARLIAVLVASVLLAASCGSDSTDADAVEPLTVAVLPTISFSPYYLAEANGYFADENLDVEFIESQRGVDTIPLLIQGDLDVFNGSINAGILNAVGAGEPVRVVADKGSLPAGKCGYSGYIGSEELLGADGRVDTAKIQNARIATGGGITSGYLLAQFLEQNDVDYSSVTIDLMGMGDRAVSVQSGQVDFASIAEPASTRLLDEGLVELGDGAEIVPGLTIAIVAFGPNLLEDRPQVADRFMRAYLRGVADYQAGPTPENVDIVAAATEVEADLLARACWPSIDPTGFIDTTVLADVQAWALEDGQLQRVLDAEEYYDPSFAERAFDSLNDG